MELSINNKNITRLLIFCLCAVICVYVFYPFLTTIIVAGIFAQVLNPLVVKIQNFSFFKYSITCRKKCAAILMLTVIAFFILMLSWMGSRFYTQFLQFSDTESAKQSFVLKFTNYALQIENEVAAYIRNAGLAKQLSVRNFSGDLTSKTAGFVFERGTQILAAIPIMVIDLFIFFVALFYFLAESDKLRKFMEQLGLFSRREIRILKDSIQVSSHAAVVSTVMAGLIHGLIVAVGSRLVNVGDFYVIFALTFFLSFIPVVGAALVALGLCAPALLEQNYTGAFVLLGIALFASAVDNLIRPLFLVRSNHRVHPLVSLLSVLGGMAVFGMPGLFIGPVLVQVTFDVFPKLIKS